MLPQVVPQARIWVFDYNSNYSTNAQKVKLTDLGQILLAFIWDSKEGLGKRPFVFIGSCFGGLVVAKVGRPEHNLASKAQLSPFHFCQTATRLALCVEARLTELYPGD
jgi:hypothetical protein